jgi:hypothetical protein
MGTPGRKRIFFLMNRWMSSAGGIQTVNRELACAMAKQSSDINCTAIVTKAEQSEHADAFARSVTLVGGDAEDNWLSVLLSPQLADIPSDEVLAVVGSRASARSRGKTGGRPRTDVAEIRKCPSPL